jgi:hypothetical protein
MKHESRLRYGLAGAGLSVLACAWGLIVSLWILLPCIGEYDDAQNDLAQKVCGGGGSADWVFILLLVLPPLVVGATAWKTFNARRWRPLLLGFAATVVATTLVPTVLEAVY